MLSVAEKLSCHDDDDDERRDDAREMSSSSLPKTPKNQERPVVEREKIFSTARAHHTQERPVVEIDADKRARENV